MTGDGPPGPVDRRSRALLGLAALAVAFAAADTYVVVLALPEMMTASGLSAEELQRAAPIISGFLLGYVGALPLVGRIADLRGRVPVLVGSLVVFSLGSLVTATSYDLTSMVTGRVLQGIGGGGLLPATLALVADLYPPQRRGLPLGVVGAVQELGNVLGPLYGAVVLAVGTWRDIFLLNLAAGLALAAIVLRARPPGRAIPGRHRRRDAPGMLLAAGIVAGVVLVMTQPDTLTSDVTLGLAFVPVAGSGRWLSPLSLLVVVLVGVLVWHSLRAAAPLFDVRAWRRTLREVDVVAALLLAGALAGVILAFSTADPQVQVFSPAGPWLLVGGALAAAAFWLRNRASRHPLVPAGTLSRTPAWGALVVSFFVGSALIAALVDIPVFARITVYSDSQLLAALVLVRFLVGLPVGAFLGGWWSHRTGAGVVTAAGMAVACAGFVGMSRWGLESLSSPWATLPLLLGGLGVGLAMAPVNAALLSATDAEVHGVASGFLVVARTVGKLVGVSALTAIGLRRYYTAQAGLPSPQQLCTGGRTRCDAYTKALQEAGLVQLHTIFLGAAICCAVAGLVGLVVFVHADTRGVRHSVLGGAA